MTAGNNVTRLRKSAMTPTQRKRNQRAREAEARAAAAAAGTPDALAMPSAAVTNAVTQGTAGPMPAVVAAEQGAAAAGIVTQPRRHGRVTTAAIVLAALSLAACSAGFEITGFAAIFPGAVLPVTCMGVALELGKLTGAAWLGRCRHTPVTLRVAVTALVVVLMALNSIAVFGFLSRAHLAHLAADEATIARHTAQVDADIAVQADVVGDLDRRIAQVDAVIGAATSRGRTQSALEIIRDQSANRAHLIEQWQAAAEKLAQFKARLAEVAGDRRDFEAADLGPLKFLAALIGAGDEQTMRAFILIVSLLLDPAAVLLLLAANARAAP
jgi:hypothetical protein